MLKTPENSAFIPESPDKKSEAPKKKILKIGGYEIMLEPMNIVPNEAKDEAESESVKDLVREIANAPHLIVRSPEGEELTANHFDDWREAMQQTIAGLKEHGLKVPRDLAEIAGALDSNYLSRITKIGGVIYSLMQDYPDGKDWQKRYEDIAGKWNSLDYNLMDTKQKTALAQELDKLIKDIYEKL